MRPSRPILALAPAAAFLAGVSVSGCAPVAITAGTAAASATTEERGFEGAVSDTVIRAEINALWLANDADLILAIELEVVEGRVLLAGHVEKPEQRVEAVRLVWKVDGVKEVINEIRVAEGRGVDDYSRDSWIAAQLRGKILFDKEIASINYSIDSVAGIVYLMGIARDKAEHERVKAHARDVPYVKRVISHVILKDDKRRQAG